jgi:hypothetical protein
VPLSHACGRGKTSARVRSDLRNGMVPHINGIFGSFCSWSHSVLSRLQPNIQKKGAERFHSDSLSNQTDHSTPKSISVSADSSMLPFSLLLSSSLQALLLLQCLASFPIDSASVSFVAAPHVHAPHVHRRRTCRSAGGLDLRDPRRPAIIGEMRPQDSHAWRQQPLRQCSRARSRMKTEQAPCVMPTA